MLVHRQHLGQEQLTEEHDSVVEEGRIVQCDVMKLLGLLVLVVVVLVVVEEEH